MFHNIRITYRVIRLPKKNFDQKLFSTKNFFQPKTLVQPFGVWILRPKTGDSFVPNDSFSTKTIVFNQKLFSTKKIFQPKTFFDQKLNFDQKTMYFDQKFWGCVWTSGFFSTDLNFFQLVCDLFSTKNFFSYQNLFSYSSLNYRPSNFFWLRKCFFQLRNFVSTQKFFSDSEKFFKTCLMFFQLQNFFQLQWIGVGIQHWYLPPHTGVLSPLQNNYTGHLSL